MAEMCPACSAVVDDAGVAPGGPLRCDRCGTRFPKPRARAPLAEARHKGLKDEVDGLGIHPALAKKYRDKVNSLPPSEEVPFEEKRDTVPEPIETPIAAPPVAPKPTRVLDEPGTTNPGRVVKPAAPPAPKPPAQRQPEGAAAAARNEPQEPLPKIPGYVVQDLIGKGAMGRVYRATHLRSGRLSAIKVLAPELAARPDFIARFEREGAAMRAVHHPGVVAVLDTGAARQPDGTTAHYIAMEYVDGPPLRRFLDKGAPSPEAALRFARLVVQALGAAHARGVIHRDLKPENILVVPGTSSDHDRIPPIDRLVLVDFGLAGILDEDADPHPNLTKSRMTMGTVNYMAPEQRTDAKRVDQRADLYAAGVIFYELLTGDLPLGRFALPTERGVAVPPSVDRCIVRALARNQDERYQTAADFDADLRAIEQEMLRSAQQDTVVGRTKGAGDRGSVNLSRSVVEEVWTTGEITAHPSGTATADLTALPWIKRSTLLWAAGALVTGVLLALIVIQLQR